MSEFKGTPGPWYRGGVENNKVSINAGNYFVALVDESSAQLANARLIAAAPELLDALQDMLSGWQYIRHNHGDLYGVGWDRAEQKATAAIDKALGQ